MDCYVDGCFCLWYGVEVRFRKQIGRGKPTLFTGYLPYIDGPVCWSNTDRTCWVRRRSAWCLRYISLVVFRFVETWLWSNSGGEDEVFEIWYPKVGEMASCEMERDLSLGCTIPIVRCPLFKIFAGSWAEADLSLVTYIITSRKLAYDRGRRGKASTHLKRTY